MPIEVAIAALEKAAAEVAEKAISAVEARGEALVARAEDLDRALQLAERRELADAYRNELAEHSEGRIPDTLDVTDWERLSPEEVAERRSEFASQRESLIREWEQENGLPWPRYKEDVVSEGGRIIHKEGQNHQAHHIRPLCLGGRNEGSNITPLSRLDHLPPTGVHRANGPLNNLVNSFKQEVRQ